MGWIALAVSMFALAMSGWSWWQRGKHMRIHRWDHWHDLNGNMLEDRHA